MEHKCVNHLEQIPPEDWDKTPARVKKLVEEMAQQIEQQSKKLTEVLTVQEQLLEKINRTSENSSSPPSSDPPGFGKKPVKQKSSKKRGGQPGHKGNSRDLYPIEECSEVIDHHPEDCTNCGATLTGVDANPYRHQIVEIPPINPIVVEHRLHQVTCTGCGTKTRATLPEDVNPSGYGVRVVALVALLSGVYRNSQRMVQSAMLEVFGISISLGTALVKQQEKLFELWHRVRDGTLSRSEFIVMVIEIRASIKATLLAADNYEITSREKTPLAKTVRTCRQLLKVESAMWLFVTTVGVEPTNNAAERAIRPAVIWRRTSFGSQTQAGSFFVARMLTVVTTLKSQKRNVLEFITQAVVATRGGTTAPSLLPETAICSDDSDLLKAA